MAPKIVRTLFALALIATALASPTPKAVLRRQTCEGQSCTIAALSGSSGQPYDPASPPSGGTYSGDCCIISYNPSVAATIYAEEPGLQAYCAANPAKRSELSVGEINKIKRQTCYPYTLIYAAGTLEPGSLGITVGPVLAAGLELTSPGNWNIMGVSYSNSIDGDYCLGLPGGQIAAQMLDSVASSCPDTKIIMSGYSEGAMVAHNGVAYSNSASRVTGVVVFGDPFDGAPIKGYSGPIQTYCASGDEVCDGEFDIGLAHLSYVGVDTTEATAYINTLVGA